MGRAVDREASVLRDVRMALWVGGLSPASCMEVN